MMPIVFDLWWSMMLITIAAAIIAVVIALALTNRRGRRTPRDESHGPGAWVASGEHDSRP